jgi:hypothetical protein
MATMMQQPQPQLMQQMPPASLQQLSTLFKSLTAMNATTSAPSSQQQQPLQQEPTVPSAPKMTEQDYKKQASKMIHLFDTRIRNTITQLEDQLAMTRTYRDNIVPAAHLSRQINAQTIADNNQTQSKTITNNRLYEYEEDGVVKQQTIQYWLLFVYYVLAIYAIFLIWMQWGGSVPPSIPKKIITTLFIGAFPFIIMPLVKLFTETIQWIWGLAPSNIYTTIKSV